MTVEQLLSNMQIIGAYKIIDSCYTDITYDLSEYVKKKKVKALVVKYNKLLISI